MKSLTQERLKELLDYNPETGLFLRKIQTSWRSPVGAVAGRRDCVGYWLVSIDGSVYKAHRLAWLYVYGVWPVADIDHRDHDTGNNAIANLREATRSQNLAYRKKRSAANRLKGSEPSASGKKYRARIKVQGRQVHLGYFDTPESAHAAYCVAATKYYGEFAQHE